MIITVYPEKRRRSGPVGELLFTASADFIDPSEVSSAPAPTNEAPTSLRYTSIAAWQKSCASIALAGTCVTLVA